MPLCGETRVSAAARTARRLAQKLASRADPRAERYWQLVGSLRGEPPNGHERNHAARGRAFQWLMAGLAARASWVR